MKRNKSVFFLTVICWMVLGFSACETDNRNLESATLRFSMNTSDGSLSSPTEHVLEKLVYNILIFQSPAPDSSTTESDGSDFNFWKKAATPPGSDGLSLEEVKSYSLSIPVGESNRSYLLLIHATPKPLETTLSNYEGKTFRDTEISMMKEGSGAYTPLSKDNYYATQLLTSNEIADGVTSVKFLLKRTVGQVVFDVFKCSDDGPVDINPPHSSTLDRVCQIGMEVSGVLPSICVANETKNSVRINLIMDNRIELDNDYFPDFGTNTGIIEPLTEDNLPDESNKDKRGATRICGPYLLAASISSNIQPEEEGDLGIKLHFSYYDTTALPGGGFNEKRMTLDLSQKKQQVAKDCYTITNIRIVNDRIIDIGVSGDIDLDYEWD